MSVYRTIGPLVFSNVSTTIDPIWDISLDLGPGLPALTNNGSNHSPGIGESMYFVLL